MGKRLAGGESTSPVELRDLREPVDIAFDKIGHHLTTNRRHEFARPVEIR